MNFRNLSKYMKDNAPALATFGYMVLTALSVYFAIKAAPDGTAAQINYIQAKERIESKPLADRKPDDAIAAKASYAVAIGKAYRRSLICAGGAIGLTYAANKMNAKTIAGLGAALAINEAKLKKVYENANRVFGKGGKEDLKEMVDCDIPPFDPDEPIQRTKHCRRKDVIEIFYEPYTGTKFESTGKNVDDAIARANYRINNDRGHSLNFNKWFSILGLPEVRAGLAVGWNKKTCPFRVYTKPVCVDGETMTGIFYENDPVSDYY